MPISLSVGRGVQVNIALVHIESAALVEGLEIGVHFSPIIEFKLRYRVSLRKQQSRLLHRLRGWIASVLEGMLVCATCSTRRLPSREAFHLSKLLIVELSSSLIVDSAPDDGYMDLSYRSAIIKKFLSRRSIRMLKLSTPTNSPSGCFD
jgi:hypothetical protein